MLKQKIFFTSSCLFRRLFNVGRYILKNITPPLEKFVDSLNIQLSLEKLILAVSWSKSDERIFGKIEVRLKFGIV